jgi:hypothetical protein
MSLGEVKNAVKATLPSVLASLCQSMQFLSTYTRPLGEVKIAVKDVGRHLALLWSIVRKVIRIPASLLY